MRVAQFTLYNKDGDRPRQVAIPVELFKQAKTVAKVHWTGNVVYCTQIICSEGFGNSDSVLVVTEDMDEVCRRLNENEPKLLDAIEVA